MVSDLAGMSIGERIKYWRERRGINQAALAGLVGRSRSWLCQIESETRQLDSFSAILDLARALRVNPWDLTGHRGDLAPNGHLSHSAMLGIRAALDTVRFPDSDTEPDVGVLTERVGRVRTEWLVDSERFDQTGDLLPGLLADTHTAARVLDGRERREALGQLASVYQLTRQFCKRVGAIHDALRVADRSVAVAAEADNLPLLGASIYGLAISHSTMGEVEQSIDVAHQGARLLEPGLPDASPEHLSMWGQLHLIRAIAAARMRDKRTVWECLAVAGRAANRNGERNDYWTSFGPTNVGIHAVNAAVEMGEPAEALHNARDVDSSRVSSVERRFSHEVQIALIYGQQREDEACLFSLIRAEQISPHNARYSIPMREMTRVLLRRENRLTHRFELRQLAHRVGVLTA